MDWTYWQNIANDQENARNNALRDEETDAENKAQLKQQQLTDATTQINNSFDQFDGNFYKNYGQQLMSFWQPDLDRQYGDAQRSVNYNFADTQPGGGSAPAEAMGRLKQAYDSAELSAQDNATSQSNQLHSSIEGQRSNLLSEANSSTDPGGVASSTAGQISSIPTQAPYSPLGDVFSNLTSQYATATQAAKNGGIGWGFLTPKPSDPSSRGSEQIIN
jgi:hypothetical protein